MTRKSVVVESMAKKYSVDFDLRPDYFRLNRARSMLREWIDSRLKHRECLIRACLLRFLSPAEIDLTARTRSPALLHFYGLRIEHILASHLITNPTPEILRIFKDGKLELEVVIEEAEPYRYAGAA